MAAWQLLLLAAYELRAGSLLTNAQRRAGLRHLQTGGPARRSSTIAMVASVPKHDKPSSSAPLELVAALKLAVDDRRRVDELVTCFDYSGSVEVDGRQYVGQGAVKRFFHALFLDANVHDLTLLGGDEASMAKGDLYLLLETGAGPRQLLLRPVFTGGLVASLSLRETVVPPGAAPLFSPALQSAPDSSTGPDGPAWETFDGRVRQRIWRRTDLFAAGNTFLKDTLELSTGRIILIVDATVWALYGPKMDAWAASVDLILDAVVAPGNEDQKTMETFCFLLDELKRVDPLRRSEPVLAVGGGVLTDTTGFACACWRRGVPWCRLPTTLLGMVDASVGIKVAINYHRKNGVGHFFSPLHTFVDSSFLGTLPLPEIRSGVGEIMKAALVHDVRLWELMQEHGPRLIRERFMDSVEADAVIKISVDAMLQCIGPDLWEEALLRPMDFGHSFSRTLEADERFQLRHGEAVAIDCVFSSLLAEQKGILPSQQADALLALYARLGLPCSIAGITAETYKRARDEIVVHRDGLLRAPLPAGIGSCNYVDDISDAEIERAFERLQDFMRANPEVLWDPSKSFNAPGAN
mmetsp:Transcript_17659/g.55768  ORF Transcript_17659/g.55768 Transcript_17659/m.55768 type:complete len:580 (-) Transcript_17659:377-2116(-)